MSIDEMIAVLQAAKAGEQIQSRYHNTRKPFTDSEPIWDFCLFDYRVKPEPREWWLQPAPTCDGYYVLTDPNRPKTHVFPGDKDFIKVREVL